MLYCALTIAGSDPSGGAGIQADLKTFSALGVYGLSVISSLTSQNVSGIKQIYPIPNFFVRSQLEAIVDDFQIDAIKVGMLYQRSIIKETAKMIREYGLSNVVLDPILRAGSGDTLLQEGGLESLREELLPLATIITPNIDEAGALAGMSVDDLDSMTEAAYKINHMGPKYTLIKGGHLKADIIIDILFDGIDYTITNRPRIPKEVHGTGCTLSAAIAAGLSKGLSPHDAVSKAQEYIQKVINRAVNFGKGIWYPLHLVDSRLQV